MTTHSGVETDLLMVASKPLCSNKQKSRPKGRLFRNNCGFRLALTGFEPALRLVDDVDAALAAHNAAVAMAVLQRTKRVLDLHLVSPLIAARERLGGCGCPEPKPKTANSMVGDTRFELVTPSMSTKCSTTELIAL